LAYKLIIRCPDAEEVIRLLKGRHGADYSRIWRVHERTIGVFSFEWTGAFGGYVNLITLDHDKNLKKCEVTIIGSGGGFPSLDSIAGSDPGKRAVKDLTNLADKNGWEITLEKTTIKSRGTPCPNCGSAYVYSEEKIKADGTVICQNCGKPFMIPQKE
jgi:predicted Zn finger-like uncharacterized protein